MTNWYVRPAGGTYGAEDGTTYANAWDGLLNVVWGSGGVVAGDTLYVCGTHVYSNPASSVAGTITPTSGTNDSTRVTIRGDYPGDGGIVWGAHNWTDGWWGKTWASEGSGTYSAVLTWDYYADFFFENVGGTWTLLEPASSVDNCKATAGSFYSATYGNGDTVYVHCTDGASPSGKLLMPRFGHGFSVRDVDYVTFKDIEFYVSTFSMDHTEPCTHITWEGCTIAYGQFCLVGGSNRFCHHITINNCTLHDAQNGIYCVDGTGTNDAASYWTVTNNTFYNIGDPRVSYYNSDAHAIGFMGGSYWTVEHNYIYNAGTPICHYVIYAQDSHDVSVRYNFIRDGHESGGAGHDAIELAGDYDQVGDRSNNHICYNIVARPPQRGIKIKQSGYVHHVYNNVVIDAGNYSYYFYDSAGGTGEQIELYNNISINPGQYHIVDEGSISGGYLKSDHNLFYPSSGDQFYWRSSICTLAEWQALEVANCIFDPNSLTSDPAFVNAGGSYILDTDFQIPTGSPAKDAGVDVGLSEDYWGSSVPYNSIPDIGVHEYEPSGYFSLPASPGELLTMGQAVTLDWNSGKIMLRHAARR